MLTRKRALTCTRVQSKPTLTQPMPWPAPAEEFRVGCARERLGLLSGDIVIALYRYSKRVIVSTPHAIHSLHVAATAGSDSRAQSWPRTALPA